MFMSGVRMNVWFSYVGNESRGEMLHVMRGRGRVRVVVVTRLMIESQNFHFGAVQFGF